MNKHSKIPIRSPSGHHPFHPDLRSTGAEHRARRMLRPPAEAPEVRGASLAAPGSDRRGGGAALREPSRGG